MAHTLGIKALRIDCIIGIHPHERTRPQHLLVDLELDADLGPATDSDQLADTIDYEAVANDLASLADGGRFRLIEAFAEAGATMLLERFGDVAEVRLEVHKPQALAMAESSFVRVRRTRQQDP
jgi:dihydroneopterin aldolase